MAKNKKSIFKIILLPIIYLSATGASIYFITAYLNKPKFIHYPSFGISLPANYAIHGIDVSHHQAVINWAEVKKMKDKNIKIGFAFIKATESLSYVDNNFRYNWIKAKENNLPRGAYHFFNAAKSGKAQAQNFIQTVVLQKGDMPPILDIEQTNGASADEVQQRVKDWLEVIEKQYKIKPIIYTNVDFYSNFLSPNFNNYPLWVAHYYVQDKPHIKRPWLFWQHNDGGRVNGIKAYVDFNAFNGDSTDFNKLLLK